MVQRVVTLEEQCQTMADHIACLAPCVAPNVLPKGFPIDFTEHCKTVRQREAVAAVLDGIVPKVTRCDAPRCTRRGVCGAAAGDETDSEELLCLTTTWKIDFTNKTIAVDALQWECAPCRLLRDTNQCLEKIVSGQAKRIAGVFKECNIQGDEDGTRLTDVLDRVQRCYSIAYALNVLIQSMEVVAVDHNGDEIDGETDFMGLLAHCAQGDMKKALEAGAKSSKKKTPKKTPKKKRRMEE